MDSAFHYELIMAKLVELQSNQQTLHKQLLQEIKPRTSTLPDQPNRRNVEQDSNQGELGQEISTLHAQFSSMKASLEQLQERVSTLSEKQSNLYKAVVAVNYKWVPWKTNTALPDRAVLACGKKLSYVSRVCRGGDDIVGQAEVPMKTCYFSYNGRTNEESQCEVLTGSGFSWEKYSGGNLPINAFPVGRKANGDALYIGRVDPNRTMNVKHSGRPGTIDGKTRIMTIAFDVDAFKYDQYDVLVRQELRDLLPCSEE